MKQKSLRSQFYIKTFIILVLIGLICGVIQVGFINAQIHTDVDNKATLIAQSIEQGVSETDQASKSIEYQIDLKMQSYSLHIADILKESDWRKISSEQLIKIRNQLGLTGITLLAENQSKDDIIGVQSTEKEEIGFGIKKFSESGYKNFKRLLANQAPLSDGFYSHVSQNFIAIPISQSGSHEKEPAFFKYAYYHKPGDNYIVDPYIQANEVNQFTSEVGPNAWIKTFLTSNPYVKEIAVLNPKVFADPSLQTKIYPPLKKVIYGSYTTNSIQDNSILKGMVTRTEKQITIQQWKDKKLYKMFLPVNKNQVIYIALDYQVLSAPLYRHSIILILSGLLSMLALFLLTSTFFNKIYENIQRIKTQIKLLAAGDLTANSKVRDNSELEDLSESANKMVVTLNRVLSVTNQQAAKAQRVSFMLEAEANQSVQKMYSISMETTVDSREQLDEILDFLDNLELYLKSSQEDTDKTEIFERIGLMRQVAKNRTMATTDMTITLSDLFKSLQGQSAELSALSNDLQKHLAIFKLT